MLYENKTLEIPEKCVVENKLETEKRYENKI
jgi:hypothetical protein